VTVPQQMSDLFDFLYASTRPGDDADQAADA
jgi:hypothetical protein